MNILFLGGDKRYRYMIQDLAKTNSVSQVGFKNMESINLDSLNLTEFDIVLLPISGINDKLEIKTETGALKLPDNVFESLGSNTKVFTGLKTKKLLELVPKEKIISFLDFEEVETVNNNLTVERSS